MRIATLAVALLLGLGLCSAAMAQSDLDAVSRVKDYYNEWLSSIPGVTEVDVGNNPQGRPEIEIHARDVTSQIKRLPSTLNGFPVVVIREPRNPGDASPAMDFDDQEQNPAASATQHQAVNVNDPAVNQTDRAASVAPAASGASTGPRMPTAPTALNPLGVPQEGVPPRPEGVPPPALR